jgi:hypothetical protein
MPEWKEVANDPWTHRLAVPGGWLYCVTTLSGDGQEYRCSLAYVPAPPEGEEDPDLAKCDCKGEHTCEGHRA